MIASISNTDTIFSRVYNKEVKVVIPIDFYSSVGSRMLI